MWMRLPCTLLLACALGSSAQAKATPHDQQQIVVPPPPRPSEAAPQRAPASPGEAIVAETNRIRANPAAYAQEMTQRRSWFKGKLMQVPGMDWPIATNEGLPALDEAIAALNGIKGALPLLRHEPALDQAALRHAQDVVRMGTLSHRGSDGSRLSDRMERAGNVMGHMGENISAGNDKPTEVLVQLLIDDGVTSRGHRVNILNPKFGVGGAACVPHPQYRSICVMLYATEFSAN